MKVHLFAALVALAALAAVIPVARAEGGGTAAATGELLLARIKPPLERQEVGTQDCGKNQGCPAGTANPARQPASYGWTQITLDTFLQELRTRGIPSCVEVSEPEVKAALQRSERAAEWYRTIHEDDDPESVPGPFLAETALSADDYRAIVQWKRLVDLADELVPSSDPAAALERLAQDAGAQLDTLLRRVGMTRRQFRTYLRTPIWNEAKQGFAAKAALAGPGAFRARLLRAFATKSCFDEVSDRMITLEIVANEARWPPERPLERDYYDAVAALVAWRHNTGHVWGTRSRTEVGDPLLLPMRSPSYVRRLWCFPYVASFYGHWSGTEQPIRCAE